jgi:ABC-type xylose transport system permease subunit
MNAYRGVPNPVVIVLVLLLAVWFDMSRNKGELA